MTSALIDADVAHILWLVKCVAYRSRPKRRVNEVERLLNGTENLHPPDAPPM